MSERIDLHNGNEIREWTDRNGFDVLNLESDGPRFFESRFSPTPGPLLLFSVEHTYQTDGGQPMVSLKRTIRASTAEDALYQYFREPKERSAGNAEHYVAFRVHAKPGDSDNESIMVFRHAGEGR